MVRSVSPFLVLARPSSHLTPPFFPPSRSQNIHNRPRTIYFARSGQSLIEHSYKADSDLSPAGWDYAERLKEAVMSRRRQVNEDRRKNGEKVDEDRKLVVSPRSSPVFLEIVSSKKADYSVSFFFMMG